MKYCVSCSFHLSSLTKHKYLFYYFSGRVPEDDQILYQTERYHTSTFGYDIPVSEDGWYLLVLKFSEVYFNAPNMKVRN